MRKTDLSSTGPVVPHLRLRRTPHFLRPNQILLLRRDSLPLDNRPPRLSLRQHPLHPVHSVHAHPALPTRYHNHHRQLPRASSSTCAFHLLNPRQGQ